MDNIILTDIPNSSTIARIGYDLQTQTMRVDYFTTGFYDYYDVTQEEYRTIASAAKKAESIGKQVKAVIKGKRFKKII
jgi:hypothetical protein